MRHSCGGMPTVEWGVCTAANSPQWSRPRPRRPDRADSTTDSPTCSGCRRRRRPGPPMLSSTAPAREGEPRRLRRAGPRAGWAALAFDQRGPWRLRGGDVAGGARRRRPDGALLAGIDGVDPSRLCVRGSSMGGFIAIHAAATSDAVAGAIAICPAGESICWGLAAATLEMRVDETRWRRGCRARPARGGRADGREAADPPPRAGRRPDPARLVGGALRAGGDPRKLVLVPGGHHRSAQHDAELQGVALRWMDRELARARAGPP